MKYICCCLPILERCLTYPLFRSNNSLLGNSECGESVLSGDKLMSRGALPCFRNHRISIKEHSLITN